MTRISLKEQYDNSSVIKQIVDLSDEVETVVETAESAKTMATEAGTKADAAKAAADTATAKNTEQDAQIASIQAKDTEQDTVIAGVKATADAALADVTINTDEISATLLLKNSVESETSKAIPLASENATGMMTKATYSGIITLGERVTALEGKTTVVYVSFTSDEPSQSEITNLFTAQTGKTPIAGNQCVDIERSLTYQYNGSEWLKTTQQVANWTNTTPGLVKGTLAGTENAGTIFAENDGTGSVNGWDDLVARVATNESAISTTIPNTYATKTALGEVESTANDAQTKANGCVDNVTISEDGGTLTFTKINDEHIEIPITSSFDCKLIGGQIAPTSTTSTTVSNVMVGSTSFGLTLVTSKPYIKYDSDYFELQGKPFMSFVKSPSYYASLSIKQAVFSTTAIDALFHADLQNLGLDDGNYRVWFEPMISSIERNYLSYQVTDGNLTLTDTSSTKTVKTTSNLGSLYVTAIFKEIEY